MSRKGFTLIEVLLALAVGMIVLGLLTSAIVLSGKQSQRQITRTQAQEDLRLLFLRLNEVGASAAYIYPERQSLTLPDGRTMSTNARVLGLLIPWGSTYCKGPGNYSDRYCAYLYYWDRRSNYESILGSSRSKARHVLVETVVRWVAWPVNTVPTHDFQGYSDVRSGVVLDSFDKSHSDLTNDLRLADYTGVDSFLYAKGDTMANGDTCNINNGCHRKSRALIQAVRPRIAVLTSQDGYVQRTEWIIPRLIPRGAEPGVAR